MRKIRKIHVVALLALLALVSLLAAVLGRAEATLTASGTIEATEVFAGAEIADKVTAVLVAEGQWVQQGQDIAKLDTAGLEPQVRQADAALRAAEARLDEAWGALRAAEARLDEAGAILRGAEARRDEAKPALRGAEAQLAEARVACEIPPPQLLAQLESEVEQAVIDSQQAQARFQAGGGDVAESRRSLERVQAKLQDARTQLDSATAACERSPSERLGQLRAAIDEAGGAVESVLAGVRTAEERLAEARATDQPAEELEQFSAAVE